MEKYVVDFSKKEKQIFRESLKTSIIGHDDFQEALFAQIRKKETIPPEHLHDIEESLEYRQDKFIHRTSLHIGQRKLFLTQLDFLNKYLTDKDQECYVIYAGAAPSNTMHTLGKMFKNVKYVLIDPNQLIIRRDCVTRNLPFIHYDKYCRNKKIVGLGRSIIVNATGLKNLAEIIINTEEQFFGCREYFTIPMCEELKKLSETGKKVFFWSDIRTDSNKKGVNSIGNNIEPDDFHIIWNTAQQYVWINILQPNRSMVKFRPPFYFIKESLEALKKFSTTPAGIEIQQAKDKGFDVIKYYENKEFRFFNGKVALQCWSRRASTESRLIISKKTVRENDVIIYDWKDYENKFCYLNNIIRPFVVYNDNDCINADKGYDNCFDCSREVEIMKDYDEEKVWDIRNKLDAIIPRNMFNEGHGKLFPSDTPIQNYLKYFIDKEMNNATLPATFEGRLEFYNKDTGICK